MGLVWKIDPFFLGNFGIQVMIFHLIWQSITSLPCPINEYVEIVQANTDAANFSLGGTGILDSGEDL